MNSIEDFSAPLRVRRCGDKGPEVVVLHGDSLEDIRITLKIHAMFGEEGTSTAPRS